MWAADRLPGWFTVASLILCCLVAVVRVSLVNSTVLDRRINFSVVCATAASLLREPAIALWIAPVVPGGTPIINDIWHFLFALTCTVILGVILLYVQGDNEASLRAYRAWLAVTCAIGVAFVLLSAPARAQGMLLQEMPGWRYATYFGLYCLIPVVTCLYVLRGIVAMRRGAVSGKDRAIMLLFSAIAVGGAINMSSLFVGALFAASGNTGSFVDQTAQKVGGELILPFIAALVLALTPSSVRALADLARLDGDSRAARRLRPVWADLTAVTPQVRMTLSWSDSWGSRSAERLHMVEREIKNSVALVSQFIEPLPQSVADQIAAAVPVEQQDAAGATVAIFLASRWVAARPELASVDRVAAASRVGPAELAEHWGLAKRICRQKAPAAL